MGRGASGDERYDEREAMNGLQFLLAPERVIHFMLVAARLGGVIAAAPFLGHSSIPVRLRASLAVGAALAFAGQVPMGAAAEIEDTWALTGALIVETAAGVMIGLVVQLILGGIMLGGEVAGIQMGLGMSNLVDPVTKTDATPVALWFQFLAMMVILSLDVHHLLLRALARSLTVVPPGALHVNAAGLGFSLGLMKELFEIAVRIAAPVLSGLLIIDTAMGLLARAFPELNVFIMGFAVKIGVGFLLMGAALPYAIRFLEQRLGDLDAMLMGLVRALG